MKIRGVACPRRIAHVALAMLLCAALGACGSGQSTSASSTGSSPPDPTIKSVTLSWSAPTQNSDGSPLTNLAGYTLHYGTASEDYTGSIEITSATTTSYVVSDSNFPAGTYYFAISAYNTEQVSSPLSSELSVTID
ncbi:MAG: fibronectin type III domain-containing protein [Steroidobacteraceae bacterium]